MRAQWSARGLAFVRLEWALAMLILLLGACGAEPLPEAEAEGCEHAQEGPFIDVEATTAPDLAPAVEAGHRAWRITLPEGAAGFLRLDVPQAGDYHFFLSAAVEMEIYDDHEALVAIEETRPVDACEALAVDHIVPLSVGRHRIRVGPDSDGGPVTLVIEAAGEAQGHDHGH
ncbi:MAG: hypothetical protein D6729_11665 [Deltaproteobacteria bacterium]|nr:MAG: hypothetical protein D6729_11665 [Deltaproteobacteria bacterium]